LLQGCAFEGFKAEATVAWIFLRDRVFKRSMGSRRGGAALRADTENPAPDVRDKGTLVEHRVQRGFIRRRRQRPSRAADRSGYLSVAEAFSLEPQKLHESCARVTFLAPQSPSLR
jgi:hypothetical protein